MKKRPGISRREFVFAAGGAFLLTTAGSRATARTAAKSFRELVRRCGTLRLACSSAGSIRTGAIEAHHAKQLEFLLSLCGEVDVGMSYSVGSTTQHDGGTDPSTLMTTVACEKGLRLEVITTGALLAGPEMTFRGDAGSLHVTRDSVFFSYAGESICPWRHAANALPVSWRNAFVTAWKSPDCAEKYSITLQNILKHTTTCLG